MKVFTCERCGQFLHFENSSCIRCGAVLGFLPDRLMLAALDPRDRGQWSPMTLPNEIWKTCGNAEHVGCNWLVRDTDAQAFCVACDLNRTIPDLTIPENLGRWADIEAAKRRMIYALIRLGLSFDGGEADSGRGLAFDFLADAQDMPVMTGHADGLITINIAEADSAERERRRVGLGEQYRTLLGHLRHEVGHYFWDRLVRDGNRLEAAREVFGDDRDDYSAALRRHYEDGPPPNWQDHFVSAYAAAHPWEDFAETWTHFLHMVDTLDTAESFGLGVELPVSGGDTHRAHVALDPYAEPDFRSLVTAWVPLTVAVNSLNRSMGQPDLYPFVLSGPAIDKLAFVHGLVRGTG